MSRFKPGDNVVVVGGPLKGEVTSVTCDLRYGLVYDVIKRESVQAWFYTVDVQVEWGGKMVDVSVYPELLKPYREGWEKGDWSVEDVMNFVRGKVEA